MLTGTSTAFHFFCGCASSILHVARWAGPALHHGKVPLAVHDHPISVSLILPPFKIVDPRTDASAPLHPQGDTGEEVVDSLIATVPFVSCRSCSGLVRVHIRKS